MKKNEMKIEGSVNGHYAVITKGRKWLWEGLGNGSKNTIHIDLRNTEVPNVSSPFVIPVVKNEVVLVETILRTVYRFLEGKEGNDSDILDLQSRLVTFFTATA